MRIVQKIGRISKSVIGKALFWAYKVTDTVGKVTIRVLLISAPAILLSFLATEVLVRLLVNVSDAPDIRFDQNLGNVFTPNQSGVYIKGKNNEIQASFRINSAGWNSPHEYEEEKSPNTYRIAVVGDSFIEALQVDYDKSYPYLLENQLNHSEPEKVEVYTFGHSGANLLHYAYLLSFAAEKYHPDLAIVNIVANDLEESLYSLSRKDNWSLLLKDGAFLEEPPLPVGNLLLKRLLRRSALVRYLTINLDLVNKSPLVNKIFYAETRKDKPNEAQHLENTLWPKAIEYILGKYVAASRKDGFSLLLVLDADRRSLYGDRPAITTNQSNFPLLIRIAAKKLGIPVVNLADTFQVEWAKNNKRFEWADDEHWNSYSHQLIARAIEDWLVKNPQEW